MSPEDYLINQREGNLVTTPQYATLNPLKSKKKNI
jgi:hypothetical protein